MGTAEKITALRQSLATYGLVRELAEVPLGHPATDASLRGGLRRGALHEVYARDAMHAASACGFASGLALRLGGKKKLVWIATEFASLEFGIPYGNGFLELGLDPKRLILLRVAHPTDALRAAGDVLACKSVGALVLEIPGTVKALDLTASRRLTLAAAQHGVSVILLRPGAKPDASAAETRWLVHSAMPPPDEWGNPRFDVQLLRNRHGELGRWELEWDGDHGFFRQPGSYDTPHHGDMAAAAADGSAATQGSIRRAI